MHFNTAELQANGTVDSCGAPAAKLQQLLNTY